MTGFSLIKIHGVQNKPNEFPLVWSKCVANSYRWSYHVFYWKGAKKLAQSFNQTKIIYASFGKPILIDDDCWICHPIVDQLIDQIYFNDSNGYSCAGPEKLFRKFETSNKLSGKDI